jgi:hypothetical protein
MTCAIYAFLSAMLALCLINWFAPAFYRARIKELERHVHGDSVHMRDKPMDEL